METTFYVDDCGNTVTTQLTEDNELLLRITHCGQQQQEGNFLLLDARAASLLANLLLEHSERKRRVN